MPGASLAEILAGFTPPMPQGVVNAGVGLGRATANAVMAPGNALRSTPDNPVTTAQMIGPAADLAQLMVGTPSGAGGLGSGARLSFTERMQLGKDLARERANRGFSEGNYGLKGRRQAPDAPKGSFDRLAAETRAGFKGDKSRIVEDYRRATGTADTDRMMLAPGETVEDMADALYTGGNKKVGALFALDRTAAGEQSVLPGAERVSDKMMAQRQASAPLRAKAPQKATDFGLFGDEPMQGDFIELVNRGLIRAKQ